MTDISPGCLNCGAALAGDYCARCGQRHGAIRQPVGHFVRESFVEFFSIDGRLWRSLGALIARPGRLTQAYLAGQRVRYLRPLRLYLIASLLFFFLLTLIDPANQLQRLAADDVAPDSVALVSAYRADLESRLTENRELLGVREGLADSIANGIERRVVDPTVSEGDTDVEASAGSIADSIAAVIESDGAAAALFDLEEEIARDEWILRQLDQVSPDSTVAIANYERAAALLATVDRRSNVEVNVQLPEWWPESETLAAFQSARTTGDIVDAGSTLMREAINRLPTVMFLLLPVFALLLKLVYVRRSWFYSEHLVFGLHTHAFAFLVFSLILLILWRAPDASWTGPVTTIVLASIPLYFVLAQKRVYGQGWIRTLGKAMIVGWAYSFALSLGALAAILLAL